MFSVWNLRNALRTMLAADVSVQADGGGKRPAALQPVLGIDAVLKIRSIWRIRSKKPIEVYSFRFHQWLARYAGSGRRTPDDRARNRRRKDRGNLCSAKPE
jgi:hypothetical protein